MLFLYLGLLPHFCGHNPTRANVMSCPVSKYKKAETIGRVGIRAGNGNTYRGIAPLHAAD